MSQSSDVRYGNGSGYQAMELERYTPRYGMAIERGRDMEFTPPSMPYPTYGSPCSNERASFVERELNELRTLCENQANLLTILQSTVAHLVKEADKVMVSGAEEKFSSASSHLAPNTFLPLSQACQLSGMPSTATIRKWIREGKLIEYVEGVVDNPIENCHYKRVGERGFIYVNPTKLLADRHTF